MDFDIFSKICYILDLIEKNIFFSMSIDNLIWKINNIANFKVNMHKT